MAKSLEMSLKCVRKKYTKWPSEKIQIHDSLQACCVESVGVGGGGGGGATRGCS